MSSDSLTVQVDKVARLIKNAQSLYAFTGAGISTDSGIPDFRSQDSGLWEGIDPIAVASIYGFRRDPKAFYSWVHKLVIITHHAHPNPAHYALAELENSGLLKGVITQNIDALHTRAGNKNLFELHGHMRKATCINCYKVHDAHAIMEKFIQDKQVPMCSCGGVLKPNVILFGEQLPIRELQGAQDAARKCDLLLIIGSSLEVAPASDIPLIAKRYGAKIVIINLEPTHIDSMAEVVIHARAAQILPDIVRRLEFA